MTTGFFVAVVFVLGAILASFFDVVADRLPRGEKPGGRSHCEQCGRPLTYIDLIPILGWLIRRGKCATCGDPIPKRHFFGELFLAFAFAAAVITLPELDVWSIAFRLLMLSALFIVIVADLRFFIIPDVVSLGLVGLLSVAHILGFFFDMPYEHVLPTGKLALYGLLFGVAFLGVFSVISRGTWMGWGDVKLAAGLGLAFGFPAIIFNLSFSFMLGAVVALLMIAVKLRTMKDLLPFGPFIALAAFPFLYGFDEAVYRFLGVWDLVKPLF